MLDYSTFLSFGGPIVSIMNKKKNKNKNWNIFVYRIRSMCQILKWNKQREKKKNKKHSIENTIHSQDNGVSGK